LKWMESRSMADLELLEIVQDVDELALGLGTGAVGGCMKEALIEGTTE
jgi:hypothetical protein